MGFEDRQHWWVVWGGGEQVVSPLSLVPCPSPPPPPPPLLHVNVHT